MLSFPCRGAISGSGWNSALLPAPFPCGCPRHAPTCIFPGLSRKVGYPSFLDSGFPSQMCLKEKADDESRLLTINHASALDRTLSNLPRSSASSPPFCKVPAECLPPRLCLPKSRSSSQTGLDQENALLAHPYSCAGTELNYIQSHSSLIRVCRVFPALRE